MDEAERLCDRVAVVDHGKVIALGSPTELIARLGGDHLIEFVLLEGETIEESTLHQLPTVVSAWREDKAVVLACTAPHVALPALLGALEYQKLNLASLTTRHASLEDVFVTLTGRHLRDEGVGAPALAG
jgi:ABC-2 type transport system ATP-binding protein